MDFEFTDDQLELRDSARTFLATACPPTVVRTVFDGGPRPADLWDRMVELDWPALALPEEHGGLGYGYLELGILVEELGRVVAPTPFLATQTQLVPFVRGAGSSFRLADVAAGTCTGTAAVAEDGSWLPEATTSTAERTSAGWVLHGTKHHVIDGTTADEVVVVTRLAGSAGPEGLGVLVVPGDQVRADPRNVMDPTLPLASVALDGIEVDGDRVLVEPGDPRALAVVERALEEATAAVALSTVATCRAVFEATLQYAKDREQFGRPIGSFQAIKHRLAEVYLSVERATALAYFAALTIAEDDDRRTVATSMAKAAAGDCQRLTVRDGLQLHGGVGFTWEHDLHLSLKRAKTGDALFGSGAGHRARLARLMGLAS